MRSLAPHLARLKNATTAFFNGLLEHAEGYNRDSWGIVEGRFLGKGAVMGTICNVCGQDMKTAESCTQWAVMLDSGETLGRFRYGSDNAEPCGDCGVKHGGIHHRFCSKEVCPRCGGQIISCGCVATWVPK